MVDAHLDLLEAEWDFSQCVVGGRLIVVGGNKSESSAWVQSVKPLMGNKDLQIIIVGSAANLRGMAHPAHYVLIGSWGKRYDICEILASLKIMQADELRPKMIYKGVP
jgi:hypothetical protein